MSIDIYDFFCLIFVFLSKNQRITEKKTKHNQAARSWVCYLSQKFSIFLTNEQVCKGIDTLAAHMKKFSFYFI